MEFWNMRNELKIFIRNLKCRWHIYEILALMKGLYNCRFWRNIVWGFGWNSSGSWYGKGLWRREASNCQVLSNLFIEHCHYHWTPTVLSPFVFFITQNYDRQGRIQPSSRRAQAVTQSYYEQESVKQACNLCQVWHCRGCEFPCLVYRCQRFGQTYFLHAVGKTLS